MLFFYVTKKPPYLEDLGVDVLWLTPFQQSNSYHGYDIKDYFTVDPRFGTLDDYRQLLTEAHARGMKILLDFVLNHTSTTNPWFEKSTKLVKETVKMPDGSYKTIDYRNFYTWQNEDYKPKDENEAKQWFLDANGYYFFSSFNSSMPELNFDYQATRDAILDVALYWMSFGLDGFRLDAVKHIYMENENPNHSNTIIKDVSDSGDYSFDVKKNNHFFLEFNAKLKATYPNALLLAENFNGDPIKIAQMYPGLDSQFNFNWYYDTSGCLGEIAQTNDSASRQQYAAKAINGYDAAQFDFSLYRTDYIDGIFTSNHDVQRARDRLLVRKNAALDDWTGDGAHTQKDVELSGELSKLWAGMCLTMPGITWIYGGDEIGMFGTKKDNEDGTTGHEDRWYRQPMKWSKEKTGDTANCEYLIGFNNYVMTWDTLNMELDGVAEQSKDAYSFNGWWTVVDATVTYMTAVPEVTETTYLYADFRAALSQHSDPVLPDEDYEDSLTDYMLIERATGEVDQVPLYVSGTEVSNALGANVFGRPVQYYNEWFKLYPGDKMSVYITSLFRSLEPKLCPIYANNQSWVTFESNTGVNNTANWLSGAGSQLASGRDKRFECKVEHNYRIYIKFYDAGGTMTIYMQPQD